MFAKLFALFFGKKEDLEPTLTVAQRMEQRRSRDLYDSAVPLRTGKAMAPSSPTPSARREDDIMSNPIHPLNPLNPAGINSAAWAPTHASHSYSAPDDCRVSSSSSYDSGSSSSSCDSSSSSSSSD